MPASNPSAMLAESISEFSKSAYKAFAEVEAGARQEVARTAAEIREAKAERDKALKSLHASHLEAQEWKQELTTCKAALAQAELTVSHQGDTIAAQADTIAQLRRELAQWKDQSRNWQEHFLRVEQERCAQSTRIDELVVEKLQLVTPHTTSTPKGSSYTAVNSAPSSHTKRASVPSPSHPPPYRTAAPISLEEYEQPTPNPSARAPAKRPKGTPKAPRRAPTPAAAAEDHVAPAPAAATTTTTLPKRPRKSAVVELPRSAPRAPAPPSATVIRRVQAVISVKQESDSEEEIAQAYGSSARSEASEAGAYAAGPSSGQRRLSRRRVVLDDDEEEGEAVESDAGSDAYRSDSEPVKPRRLRNRSRINYEEDEPSEEDDELMLNADDNQGEVFGASRKAQASKHQSAVSPPKKKRKYVGR